MNSPLSFLNTTQTATADDSRTASATDSGGARFQVIKRDGQAVAFDADKIAVAVTKAFLAVEGGSSTDSARVRKTASNIAAEVWQSVQRHQPAGGAVHIEALQDQVELALMRGGHHQVARSYVLYREKRASERAQQQVENTGQGDLGLGAAVEGVDQARVRLIVEEACSGLNAVEPERILNAFSRQIFSGMDARDVRNALVLSARTLIENDPDYSLVTARLLLDGLRQEALGFLGIASAATQAEMQTHYPSALRAAIAMGVEVGLYSERLAAMDLERLGAALHPERDLQWTYLGLQTLYDRYLMHWDDQRFELPQVFLMRVAMGLALNEDDPEGRAIEFYELLSSFDYMCSTPTLFNSGTRRSQLSSCYLTTVADDLESIYSAVRDNALLSKWAGGLGNDWTPVRALGSHIKGTNGKSQGVVPFLKVVNDTAVAVNQGGKRKGAVCAYLETWHLDIEEFLELRKNTGDERRRTHDMNSANWIPDLFMKRVFQEQDWTLFSPADVPDLHDLYGQAFEARYEEYERMVERGEIRLFKKVPAVTLWRKMLSMLFETGHPWVTFKDPCNLRSPQQHVGVVHSSNLCTEITLNTSADEIAVCNLGSINLANHVLPSADSEIRLDVDRLRRTVRTAVRMLDNVIDINYYAVPQAERSNLRHRPVGLGIMGFQDALYALEMSYASVDAVHFADASMEIISYLALEASSDLADERGSYESFPGSLWDRGILPIDSLKNLVRERGEDFCVLDTTASLDWSALREKIAQQGMRNSNVMAIAPTATISNIVGVSQSIEPTYQHLFVKSNLSGEFVVINPWLVRALKERGLWDSVMVNDLKFFDGSVARIDRIPQALKQRFMTAFEMDSRWLVEAASRRQKWIDQAQSLNLYLAQPSGKTLDNLYKLAWARGLKTTYYLRSLGATGMEKSAEGSAVTEREAEPAPSTMDEPAVKFCAIDDPDCEACQ